MCSQYCLALWQTDHCRLPVMVPPGMCLPGKQSDLAQSPLDPCRRAAAGDQDDEDEDAFLHLVTKGELASPRADGFVKLRHVGEAAWSAACPISPGAHTAGRPRLQTAGCLCSLMLCPTYLWVFCQWPGLSSFHSTVLLVFWAI